MRSATRNRPTFFVPPGLAQLLAVGWLLALAAVCLVAYGGWQAPVQFVDYLAVSSFGPGPMAGLFWRARLADAGCAMAIVATAFAAGAVVLDRITPGKNLLAALFAMVAGFWLLAVTVLVIGAISVARVPWAFAWAACWLLPAPRRFFQRPVWKVGRIGGWEAMLLGCLLAALLLNLPGALAPPFEYDELEYHLGALAEYVKAGHIIFLPHNFYSNLPQLTEMLYLLGLTARSDVAAKLLHALFGVLTAVGIYALAARLWSKRVGLTAAALFYCMPFVQDLSETARVDLATTFFGALAFGGLLLDREQPDGNSAWLGLSAIAAGAALATKWTAAAVVVVPILIYLLAVRLPPKRVAGYAAVILLAVLPWLMKNWLLAGNPVYPLFDGVFRSAHWSAQQTALFAQKHYPAFGWTDLAQVVLLAWHFSFVEPYAVPLLLMVAPLALLATRPPASARRAGWMFLMAYAGWFLLTFRPWRFLLPACPLAAMAGAYALENIDWGRWARLAARAAIGLVLVTGLATMGLNVLVDVENPDQFPPRLNLLGYARGLFPREEFARRMGRGEFEPIFWMNEHLPAGEPVLYLGEARAYYARNPVVWATAFDQHPFAAMYRQADSPASLEAALRAQGIGCIYVNNGELVRLTKNYGYLAGTDWRMLNALLKEHATLVHQSGHNFVYQLNP